MMLGTSEVVGGSAGEAADTVGEVAEEARSFGTAVVDRLPMVLAGAGAGLVALALALLLAKAVERTPRGPARTTWRWSCCRGSSGCSA